MIALTMAQVDERRVEVASLTDQIRALGRRRRHLEREILSGYAQPERVDARQLSLPVEDKAALDEAASEAVAEVMAKKGKAPAKEAAVLGPLTMTQVRQAILDEIGTWKRWHSGAAADQALWAELRRTGHDEDEDGDSFDVARAIDDVGMQALTALATEGKIQCSERPGSYNNSYAPLGVSRTAEGGPEEPKPSRKPAVKKGKATPKKATKPAKKAARTTTAKKGRKPTGKPPAPPAVPATGHAQQVLRAWIYDRLAHTGPMSIDQLYAAAPAFHREDLVGTVHLLLACELVMEWEEGTYASSENLTGRTIDALVLDNIADALIDEPMTSAALASALSVQHAIVWDLLVELRDKHRVTRQGDLWRLATAQDRTLPILPDLEPAPAREEAADHG